VEKPAEYLTGQEPEGEHWSTTDELVAMARAHRQGEEYPTPEELLRNLPRMLRGICDFVLSGEADVFHTAYAIASLIEVIEHVRDTPPRPQQQPH